MDLAYLDNKIPARWLLLVCYYLPFINSLPFYVTPSVFYFQCRAFINTLKKNGQKIFDLAQLPNLLFLLVNYSMKETEEKLSNEIVSEILAKECKKFNLEHLLALLEKFDPNPKNKHTSILNHAFQHIPTQVYTEYLVHLNDGDCTLRDLQWCIQLKNKFTLEERLMFVLSLPDNKLIAYPFTLIQLVIQEYEDTLLNTQFENITRHTMDQLLEFIFRCNPHLIFSNVFIQALLNHLLEERDPLLISHLLELDLPTRFTFFDKFLSDTKNLSKISHHFLTVCQKDLDSSRIDQMINYVFITREAMWDADLQQEQTLTQTDWKISLLNRLQEEAGALNLFQFLAIQALTQKQLNLEKLKTSFNTNYSLEYSQDFSLACLSFIAKYTIQTIKIYLEDNFMVHIPPENTRQNVHRAFYKFFNNEYIDRSLDVLKLIFKKLPVHLQASSKADLNFLQQLLSELYSLLSDPNLVEYKNKQWMLRGKNQREDEEKSEAYSKLLERIRSGLQSSVSYQRMQEIFGTHAVTIQEKWKKIFGIHFFDANNKEEYKAALHETAEIIRFNRECNDFSCLSISPSSTNYFSLTQ